MPLCVRTHFDPSGGISEDQIRSQLHSVTAVHSAAAAVPRFGAVKSINFNYRNVLIVFACCMRRIAFIICLEYKIHHPQLMDGVRA